MFDQISEKFNQTSEKFEGKEKEYFDRFVKNVEEYYEKFRENEFYYMKKCKEKGEIYQGIYSWDDGSREHAEERMSELSGMAEILKLPHEEKEIIHQYIRKKVGMLREDENLLSYTSIEASKLPV